MAKRQKPRVKLPPLDQIGIVVKDLDKAIEYYSSIFGWGPFHVREFEMRGFAYRGGEGYCRARRAFTQSGPVQVELVQVLEGETPHTEYLQEKGEGVQHLRFIVDDLKGMLAELAKEGIEPIYAQSYPEFGVDFAYVDSDQVGGVVFELIEARTEEGRKRIGR